MVLADQLQLCDFQYLCLHLLSQVLQFMICLRVHAAALLAYNHLPYSKHMHMTLYRTAFSDRLTNHTQPIKSL
jgi:hypothetical protein